MDQEQDPHSFRVLVWAGFINTQMLHSSKQDQDPTGLSRSDPRSDPRWNISSATELHNLLINFMRLMIHLYLPPTAKSEMA